MKGYKIYYKLFSFKFLIRALLVKLLNIKEGEVRQLNIADDLIAWGFSFHLQNAKKVQLSSCSVGTPLNVVLRKRSSDLLVFNQVLLRKEYEPLYDLIRKHGAIEKISVVVDAGANIGLSALYFMRLFPKAYILAIEPSESNFLVLQENINLNKCNVVPLKKALLAGRGPVRVINNFRDRMDWSTQVVPSDSSTDVEGLSLADFMLENGLETIDILKVDIEGLEAELFASDEFLMELRNVRFIAIELHEERVDRIAIINILQTSGFKLLLKGETLFGVNQIFL